MLLYRGYVEISAGLHERLQFSVTPLMVRCQLARCNICAALSESFQVSEASVGPGLHRSGSPEGLALDAVSATLAQEVQHPIFHGEMCAERLDASCWGHPQCYTFAVICA